MGSKLGSCHLELLRLCSELDYTSVGFGKRIILCVVCWASGNSSIGLRRRAGCGVAIRAGVVAKILEAKRPVMVF